MSFTFFVNRWRTRQLRNFESPKEKKLNTYEKSKVFNQREPQLVIKEKRIKHIIRSNSDVGIGARSVEQKPAHFDTRVNSATRHCELVWTSLRGCYILCCASRNTR